MDLVTQSDRDSASEQALKDVPCNLTPQSTETDHFAWRSAYNTRYWAILAVTEQARRAGRTSGRLDGYRRDLR